MFEVRIYPEEARLPAIIRGSAVSAFTHKLTTPEDNKGDVVAGIDLRLLDQKLKTIDYADIARRRWIYNQLYHEALLVAEPGKGLSFTKTLMLLAHYKLTQGPDALLSVQPSLSGPAQRLTKYFFADWTSKRREKLACVECMTLQASTELEACLRRCIIVANFFAFAKLARTTCLARSQVYRTFALTPVWIDL